MDPIAFRIPLPFLDFTLEFTWYGISVVLGVLAGALYATYEARRRGDDPDNIWDMFIALVFFGIIGARLFYVLLDTLGGNSYYLDNPIQILNIPAGGLNIFGALIIGMLTVAVFCRRRKLNPWQYLDYIAPGVLLGQGLARWGNYVNQELYGPPTTLPWGIPIDAQHRIPPYNDLARYPLSTRFHPTFLYETIYDLIAFGVLLYLIRRFEKRWRTGTIFGAYLIFHGMGRFIIEFFRPDQPRIPGTDISYSRLLAALFVLAGVVIMNLRQRHGAPYPAPALAIESTAPLQTAVGTVQAEPTAPAGTSEELTSTPGEKPSPGT